MSNRARRKLERAQKPKPMTALEEVEFLKARVYDRIAATQKLNGEIAQLNQRIAELLGAAPPQAPPPPEKPPDPPKPPVPAKAPRKPAG